MFEEGSELGGGTFQTTILRDKEDMSKNFG
jgi:hypothetical protein